MTNRFVLEDYLPHRHGMLLIDRLISVDASSSQSELVIGSESSFFVPEVGVPSWIGVEYMGQTAACIAGYQLIQGLVEPHIGFLLGTRKYIAHTDHFVLEQSLSVTCKSLSNVGGELANFDCAILDKQTDQLLAEAKLTVFRKPTAESQES